MDNYSLIERIRNADGEAEFERLYKSFRKEFIIWAINKFKCSIDEASEVYHQSMIILYEKIISEKKTEITTKMKTFVFSIGKNKMREVMRKKNSLAAKNYDYYTDTTLFYGSDEPDYENELTGVEKSLEQLGEPCKTILVQFYYHKKSITDIAQKLTYKNAESLKTQKYKCIQRLKRIYQTSHGSLNINIT